MSIRFKDRLKHILIETEYLISILIKIKHKDKLKTNKHLKRSTERSIEIIGEAVKTIPEEIKQLSPNTQWKDIAKMRDNIIHRYHDIDYDVIWEVIIFHAPNLNREVKVILANINRQEYLGYKSKIQDKTTVENYFVSIDNQEKTDIKIASFIIKEYPNKFKNVAIAEAKDIISASDRAIKLSNKPENTTPNEYINKIIKAALGENKKQKNKNKDNSL